MTEKEFDGVWTLLTTCRPKDKALQSRQTKRAWWLVLEPYEADAVKNAVLAFIRESNLSPFPGDIAQRLSPLPGTDPAPQEQVKDAAKAGADWRATFSRRWDATMEARGYPLLEEWLERGKPADEWWAARARCQLDDPQWMALLTVDQREELRAVVAGA